MDEKRFCLDDKKLKIFIPDMNLFYAIEDYITDEIGFIDYSLNSKVLVIPSPYIFKLIEATVSPEEAAKLKKVVKNYAKENGIDCNEKDVMDYILQITQAGVNVTDIIKNIYDLFSGKEIISGILENVIRTTLKYKKQ